MEVQQALQARRSIRKFTEAVVSKEEIDVMMHAAMSGPSACNKMPWEFYVVTDKAVIEKLRKASKFTDYDAPLLIVVCGNLSRALPMQLASYWIQDCSAATENILLAATDLGLGAVWCGIHPQKRAEKKVREILGLSEKLVPLNLIYVGHPNQEQEPRDQYKEAYIHYI